MAIKKLPESALWSGNNKKEKLRNECIIQLVCSTTPYVNRLLKPTYNDLLTVLDGNQFKSDVELVMSIYGANSLCGLKDIKTLDMLIDDVREARK